MALAVYLVLIILFVLLKYFLECVFQRWKLIDMIGKIPGYKSYPLIGSAWLAWAMKRQDIIKIALARPKFFRKGISSAWLGPYAEVRVDIAEYAEKVLLSKHCFSKAKIYHLLVGHWIGDGLITTGNEEKWFRHRRILTPTFHFEILQQYCLTFSEKADRFCELLQKYSKTGEVFEISKYVYRQSLDVIIETAFGVKLNIQDNIDSEFLRASEEIAEIGVKRVLNPLLHNDFIFRISPLGRRVKELLNILHGFSEKIIAERKALREKESKLNQSEGKSKKRLSFLDLLLHENEKMPFASNIAIRDEVDSFMLAGHETTSMTISWGLLYISNNLEVQELIWNEQIDILGDCKEAPDYNFLPKMKYLDCVLKEILRIHPPLPCVSRQTSAPIKIEGYTVPAGCMLSVNLYEIMRDPKYFPNPEKFNPDRFLPENNINKHPFSYIPFSAGPRNCIGKRFAELNIKIFLSTFFRNYKLIPVDKTNEVECIRELVAKPYPGINVRLERRP